MKLALHVFILHCTGIDLHTPKKTNLHLGKDGVCSIPMDPSLVQALTFLQGEKQFDSLSI